MPSLNLLSLSESLDILESEESSSETKYIFEGGGDILEEQSFIQESLVEETCAPKSNDVSVVICETLVPIPSPRISFSKRIDLVPSIPISLNYLLRCFPLDEPLACIH